jgi:hypothetical protein
MKIGFGSIVAATLRVSAALQKTKRTLIDAFRGLKRKVCQKTSELAQRVRKSVQALKGNKS